MEKSLLRLNRFIEKVPVLFNKMTEDMLSNKPSPEKWSKKEILGHLIDSAVNNHIRFIKIQLEPAPYQITPYKQNDWVKLNRYQQKQGKEIAELWAQLNKQIYYVVSQIPKEVLQTRIKLANGESTLEWLITDYVEHMEHHLKQIFGSEFE